MQSNGAEVEIEADAEVEAEADAEAEAEAEADDRSLFYVTNNERTYHIIGTIQVVQTSKQTHKI